MFKYLIFIFLVLVNACSDVVKSDYENYIAAKESKLFVKGWLPDILPTSTFEITVKNNLDLSTSEGNFKIPESDLEIFTNQLNSGIDFGGEIFYYYWIAEKDTFWIFHIKKNGYVQYEMSDSSDYKNVADIVPNS